MNSTQSSNDFNGDAISFEWSKKSFIADTSLPLEELVKNVKSVSVTVNEGDLSSEVDKLIENIMSNDATVNRLKGENEKHQERLDAIMEMKVKMSRKENSLVEFLRNKFKVAMLPFTTIIWGRKYKATKSRGSESNKPNYEQIVETLKQTHPKLVAEIKKLEVSTAQSKTTPSRWGHYSKLDPDKD